MQALHRAGLNGRVTHLQAEADGGARLGQLRCGGGQASRWRPGGPPRMCGQGKGAFVMAAMNIHPCLHHGLNHLDRKNLKLKILG